MYGGSVIIVAHFFTDFSLFILLADIFTASLYLILNQLAIVAY